MQVFNNVVQIISSDWLDPLKLFETAQSARAQADGLEGRNNVDEDVVARVAQLEKEIRRLETSGLVRHEELIASAARRNRFER